MTEPARSASLTPVTSDLASVGQPSRLAHRLPAWRRWLAVIASYLFAVLLLLTLNFALPRALPGQPLAALSDPRSSTYVGDAERLAAVQSYYGLDRPLAEQFARYARGLARGDLGTSIRVNVPVRTLLAERLPWTLLLGASAVVAATALGMLGGICAGWRRGSSADRGLVTLFVALDNVPLFFLSSAALYVLSVQLGWFPLSGGRTPFSQSWGLARQAVDVVHHLVLPASMMALQFAAFQFQVMRAGMVSELGSDYLKLGRAKGLPERVVKYRYAARNALLPTVSLLGLQVGAVITAAIFVESVFAYPGLGRLLFESVASRDYPTMQGVFLLLTTIVLGANLAMDILYRRLDPRVAR